MREIEERTVFTLKRLQADPQFSYFDQVAPFPIPHLNFLHLSSYPAAQKTLTLLLEGAWFIEVNSIFMKKIRFKMITQSILAHWHTRKLS